MLSRRDYTYTTYIRLNEQAYNKYDNNITIIIYNIKLHSESNSTNLMCGKHLLTTYTYGIPEWPLSATRIGILIQIYSFKGFHQYLIYFYLRKL